MPYDVVQREDRQWDQIFVEGKNVIGETAYGRLNSFNTIHEAMSAL